MGPRRARVRRSGSRASRADAFVVAGCRGALDEGFEPGDARRRDRRWSVRTAAHRADPRGLAAALGAQRVCASTSARSPASSDLPTASRARNSRAARGACAVDMESFWLAPTAREPSLRRRCARSSDGPGSRALAAAIVARRARGAAQPARGRSATGGVGRRGRRGAAATSDRFRSRARISRARWPEEFRNARPDLPDGDRRDLRAEARSSRVANAIRSC